MPGDILIGHRDKRYDSSLQNSDTIGDRPRITLQPTVSPTSCQLAEKVDSDFTPQTSRYKKGDSVYIDDPQKRSYEGPFLIEKVVGVAKYTLCFENGDKAKDGKEFEQKMLVDG